MEEMGSLTAASTSDKPPRSDGYLVSTSLTILSYSFFVGASLGERDSINDTSCYSKIVSGL